MNLIIDIGNSFIKFAVFQQQLLFYKERLQINFIKERIEEVLTQFPKINAVIVSSVSNFEMQQIESILKGLKVVELNIETPLPFKIHYDTPKTLGVDRVALAAAAHQKFPSRNCLVIDAGSCITYEVIDKKSIYQGGIIGPGLQMRYKSLNEFTAKLPLLNPKNENRLIGKSTASAIHNGAFTAMTIEINGIIEQFSNTYDDLVVILTGGDAHFLSKRLKNGIFAHSNFLIRGLNYILEYNIDR